MKIHKLRINYKSGISMEAEFIRFRFGKSETTGKTFYEFEAYKDGELPVPWNLQADNIESVWQISSREVKE